MSDLQRAVKARSDEDIRISALVQKLHDELDILEAMPMGDIQNKPEPAPPPPGWEPRVEEIQKRLSRAIGRVQQFQAVLSRIMEKV